MSIRYKDYEDRNVLDDIIEAERICLFWEKFKELDAECQQLFKLRFENEKYDQIAEKMGLTNANACRQKTHTCKQSLMRKMKNDPRFYELKT